MDRNKKEPIFPLHTITSDAGLALIPRAGSGSSDLYQSSFEKQTKSLTEKGHNFRNTNPKPISSNQSSMNQYRERERERERERDYDRDEKLMETR